MNQSDCPSASPRASARRRIGGLALLSALALLLLAGPAGSQDGPDPAGDKPGAAKDDAVTTADFAPQWKVGQSWTVETFVPDLREAVTGRPEETRPEIPGFPRLRGGVPEGFKRGTVFTVTVTRNDATISDDKVIAYLAKIYGLSAEQIGPTVKAWLSTLPDVPHPHSTAVTPGPAISVCMCH